MDSEETKQKYFDYSKEILFNTVPESIEVFDKEDVAYFIFSEFTEYIIANINYPEKIKKTIIVIEKLLAEKQDVLETMIIIQVFQKIYPLNNTMLKFRDFLSENALLIFDKYLIEYNKPIEIHPSLKSGKSRKFL